MPAGEERYVQRFWSYYKYQTVSILVFILLCAWFWFSFSDRNPHSKDIVINSPEPTSYQILVDISGAVQTPNVYYFNEGARMNDAIESAGGFTDTVDQAFVDENINKAEVLVDGQKIYIPFKQEEVVAGVVDDTKEVPEAILGRVSINRATASELESLPGIGSAYAQRIIDARPFSSIEGLLNVEGIGTKTYERIKEKVTLY